MLDLSDAFQHQVCRICKVKVSKDWSKQQLDNWIEEAKCPTCVDREKIIRATKLRRR